MESSLDGIVRIAISTIVVLIISYVTNEIQLLYGNLHDFISFVLKKTIMILKLEYPFFDAIK